MQNKQAFIKKILLLTLLTLSPLLAIKEANIQNVMSSKIATITKTLQNNSLNINAKKDTILPLVDSIFSYKTMSKIALGKAWKKLSASQKQSFINKFEEKLKNSYFEKLNLYTNEEVIVKKVEKVKATRIKLYVEIRGVEQNYELIYKFYKIKGADDWLIYDVEITGVSIIQTYRKQFSEFLKSKSFSELLNSL